MKAYTKYSITMAKEKLEKNFLNNLQSLFFKDDSILSKDNVSELK